MARVDTHSRVVAWLKIALPLTALAILATLFLLADRIDPDDALPNAEVDVEDRARTPRMTAPTYAGTTSDGAALILSANEARPASDATRAAAYGLRVTLETPDGGRTDLSAATAEIDNDTREIVLSGGVEATTSTGYVIESEGITARMDRTGLSSTGGVTATGPAGRIVADRMDLRQGEAAPGAYVLVFNGSVKLIYTPGAASRP